MRLPYGGCSRCGRFSAPSPGGPGGRMEDLSKVLLGNLEKSVWASGWGFNKKTLRPPHRGFTMGVVVVPFVGKRFGGAMGGFNKVRPLLIGGEG